MEKKEALASNGELISYKNLINTIPLLEFLRRLSPLPAELKGMMKKLFFFFFFFF